MSLIKASELKQHTADELNERETNLHKEYFELSQKRELGQLDRPHRFRQIRREIAIIKTVLNEKKAS